MFASGAMIQHQHTSQKDDVESLVYLLCYLQQGTLPVLEHVTQAINDFELQRFFNSIMEYRLINHKHYPGEVKALLEGSYSSVLEHALQLEYMQQPDYTLIKFLVCSTPEDEASMLAFKEDMQQA